jgi:hypothetical protein
MDINTVIQQPALGFGSYLESILPPDIAAACGALSASFLQVKNITNIPVEKFAQVVTNLETTVGLNVNGTSVPTDLSLRTVGRPLIALGSGPQGTYTASDFFGCMSGLPYNGPLKNIFNKLNEVSTTKLSNIYHEIYLAVTWQHATVTVQYTTNLNLPSGPTTYTVTGLTVVSPGGGYGRGSAVGPSVTISNGGSGIGVIGADDTDINTFGRVKTITLSSPGPDSTTIPTATIECPPTASLPVQSNGTIDVTGVNTASGTSGWPGMNSVIQNYIDQANAEIDYINQTKRSSCQSLNNSWNATGTQLTIEQRARQTGLKPPLEDIRENYISLYPTVVYNFVDDIAQYSKSTEPHMYAQTLENISDLQTTGGQSLVASMRQQRNQDRLVLLGVPLDNNIPDFIPDDQQKALIANGSLPTGTSNPNIPSGATIANTDSINITPTAVAIQQDAVGNEINVTSLGSYDPISDTYIVGDSPLSTTLDNGAAFIPSSNIGTPGSFAGSPYTNLIPPELNTWYTSNTLYPSTYTVAEAIDEVVRCNCDCWQLA